MLNDFTKIWFNCGLDTTSRILSGSVFSYSSRLLISMKIHCEELLFNWARDNLRTIYNSRFWRFTSIQNIRSYLPDLKWSRFFTLAAFSKLQLAFSSCLLPLLSIVRNIVKLHSVRWEIIKTNLTLYPDICSAFCIARMDGKCWIVEGFANVAKSDKW